MRFHFNWFKHRHWLLLSLALYGGATGVLANESAPGLGLGLGQVLQMTLASNRDVQISQAQVERASGSVMQAQGAFDTQLTLDLLRSRDRTLLTEVGKLTFPGASQEQDNASGIAARLEKRLPLGAILSGSIASSYASNDLALRSGTPAQTTRKVVVGLSLPLARGAGEHNAALSAEQAAQLDWQAALAKKRFSVSLSVRDAAIAFWDYLASSRQLEIARRGEARTAALIEELRKLIAADEIPAADLDLALANHAERINARIGAEQSMLQTRQTLILAMGVAVPRLVGMAAPVGDFPAAQASAMNMNPESLPVLVERSMARRGDWLALERQIEALRERVAAAQDLTLPQVDLSINLSSTGLREGSTLGDGYALYASPFAGPSISTQLNVKFPFANQAASGQLRQASAALTEAEIRREALRSQIATTVEATMGELTRSAESLRVSAEIVTRYAKTLENERTRRRLGTATLIDVINVEDRYFRALLDDVQRQRNHAVSVARLGHEVDALLRPVEATKAGEDSPGSGFEVRETDLLRMNMP